MIGDNALSFQPLLNTLPDGFDVPVGIPCADNKVISKGTKVCHVQQNDVLRLLFRSNFGSQTCYLLGFQKGANLLS